MVGVAELEKRGYPEDILHAIKGHADYLDVPRDTLDVEDRVHGRRAGELLVAGGHHRPERLEGMKAKGVCAR